MLLLMLLAVAIDLEDFFENHNFFKNKKQESMTPTCFHSLLETPTCKV